MTKRDYYQVLGIDRTADPSAVKKAYRQKAVEFHPDLQLVATQRIHAFGHRRRAFDRAEVLRPAVVVENDALVQLVEFSGHGEGQTLDRGPETGVFQTSDLSPELRHVVPS